MAEAVLHSLASSHPRLSHVDSAGTGAYHTGAPPDSRTMSTLEDNGIAGYEHAARKVKASDFTEFDYVLAMDDDNLYDLERARQRAMKNRGATGKKAKIMLFGDFGGRKGEQVGDPYYGATDGFEITYEQMVRFSKGFIKEVLDGEEIISS
jgi:low molecular weight phosphotyrosine protein phosphatase